MKKNLLLALGILCGVTMMYAQNIVNFEELTLEPETHWNGADQSGNFSSQYLTLYNEFTDWGGGMSSWFGFAYTNETDVTTMSYLNEFSAAAGSGVFGSEKYAVAYVQGDYNNNYEPIPISMKIDRSELSENIPGMFVCLNAYSSLYMAENNIYENGKHWLIMQIIAIDSELDFEISKEIILADYRFEETAGFKIDDWAYISMDWASTTDSLVFIMRTSDAGEFGPNTPTYFCIDDFGSWGPDETPELQTEIKNEYNINSGESVQLTALAKGGVQPYSIIWSDILGLDNYQSQTPIASPTQTTTWTVTITDAFGAQVIEDVTVVVGTTEIAANNINPDKIYFSSNENLYIECKNIIEEIKIYDITGKLVISEKNSSSQLNIDVTKLPKGMYIIKMSDGNSVVSRKILK
jgi:hypothetical protein